jgi:hypothetical protein
VTSHRSLRLVAAGTALVATVLFVGYIRAVHPRFAPTTVVRITPDDAVSYLLEHVHSLQGGVDVYHCTTGYGSTLYAQGDERPIYIDNCVLTGEPGPDLRFEHGAVTMTLPGRQRFEPLTEQLISSFEALPLSPNKRLERP